MFAGPHTYGVRVGPARPLIAYSFAATASQRSETCHPPSESGSCSCEGGSCGSLKPVEPEVVTGNW